MGISRDLGCINVAAKCVLCMCKILHELKLENRKKFGVANSCCWIKSEFIRNYGKINYYITGSASAIKFCNENEKDLWPISNLLSQNEFINRLLAISKWLTFLLLSKFVYWDKSTLGMPVANGGCWSRMRIYFAKSPN